MTPQENEAPPSAPEPELPTWARRRATVGQLPERDLAVFIGRKWDPTYKRKFVPFVEDGAFTPTWNWSAALGSPFWFLYRKLYLAFAGFFVLPGFAFRLLTDSDTVLTMQNMQAPENKSLVMMNVAVWLSSAIAAGGTANWLLFRRARAATRLVAMQQISEADSLLLLQRIGGVNRGGAVLFVVLSLVMAMAQLAA